MCDPHRRASLWSAENKDAGPSSPRSKQQLQSICSGLGVGLYGSETASLRRRRWSSDLKGGGCLRFLTRLKA